jgi:SAM-dependent methyltransferase
MNLDSIPIKPFRVACYFILRINKIVSTEFTYFRYRKYKRPYKAGETTKALHRRIKENFFEKYCNGEGLDIGYGGDLITATATGIDVEHGDATFIYSVRNKQFDFVYSSHLLEHLSHPEIALRNWWRVLKTNGCLIIYLPHRDLYEQKLKLPSKRNPDHKFFYLPDRDELPDTLGLQPLIEKSLDYYHVECIKVCNENYIAHGMEHPKGEYSIEAVIRKVD